MQESIENSALAKVFTPAGFSPLPACVILEVLSLPELAPLVSPALATYLLSRWSSHSAQLSPDTTPLLDFLLDHGANPWEHPKVLDLWLKEGVSRYLEKALLHPDAPAHAANALPKWLALTVASDRIDLTALLLDGWERLLAAPLPASLFAGACSARMVRFLLEKLPAEAALSDQPVPLVEAWLSQDTPSNRFGYVSRVEALAFHAMRHHPDGLFQPAFDALPLCLSAAGAHDKACAWSGLTRHGFKNAPTRISLEGASPLLGWSLSILGKIQTTTSARRSLRLLSRCFSTREDIWDTEWVLAAAAIEVLSQQHPGKTHALAEVVKARKSELVALPGLNGGENRWMEAVKAVMKVDPSPGVLSHLNASASSRVWMWFAAGKPMQVEWGSVDQMNALALNQVHRYSYGHMGNLSLALQWSRGIPAQFVKVQANHWPAWLSKMNLKELSDALSIHMEAGNPPLIGMPVHEAWPARLRSWAEQGALSQSAPQAPSQRPRPRM